MEEARYIGDLEQQLGGVSRHVSMFASAVDLLQFSQSQAHEIAQSAVEMHRSRNYDARDQIMENARRYSDWALIAAQNAAVTVSLFPNQMAAIDVALDRCSTIKAMIDRSAMKNSKTEFDTFFPDIKEVRDGYAHSVSAMFTPDHIEKHSHDNMFITGGLDGDVLTYTYKGKMASLAVNKASLRKLHYLMDKLFGAFERACQPPTDEQIRRQLEIDKARAEEQRGSRRT